MAERDMRIDRLLLGQEITDFLYREAELLDERRYREWLDLLADDVRYWMPIRRNVKLGDDESEFTRANSDINWFDEGKGHARPACQADRDRHSLGRGAALAPLPSRHQCSGAGAPTFPCRSAGGLGHQPLPDLSQPAMSSARDRSRIAEEGEPEATCRS